MICTLAGFAQTPFCLFLNSYATIHDVIPLALTLALFPFSDFYPFFRPTLDLDVVMRASASEHTYARAFINKFVQNANAQNGNIRTKGANDKARHKRSIIKELEAFLAASPDNTVLTDLSSELFSNETVLEILGPALGVQAISLVEIRQAERAAAAALTSEPPSCTNNEQSVTDATVADDRSAHDASAKVDLDVPIAKKQHTPPLTENQETSTTAQGRDCDLPGDPATEQRVQMFSRLLKRTLDEGGSPDALIREMFKRPEPPTVIDTTSKVRDDLSELHSVAGGQQMASQQRHGLLQSLQHSMHPTPTNIPTPKQSVLPLGTTPSLAGLASNLLGNDTGMFCLLTFRFILSLLRTLILQ